MPIEKIRISFEELKSVLMQKLLKLKFSEDKADKLSEIIAESSLDGVYSHGINRFPRLFQTVTDGFVDKDAEPEKVMSSGTIEQWDGRRGPGILNAWKAMERAMELATSSGIGCVGLRNTNHWLRGGTYGWQAANAGYIGICFTNTKPNMIPWGGSDPRIGNNPFIIAIPREEGHVVLDMAMSQYSFGKIEQYAINKMPLPYPGGFDDLGNLSTDPAIIFKNEKALPIGYWKGSALSMVLDMLTAVISGGDFSKKVGEREEEYGLSQLFIAIQCSFTENYKDQFLEEVIAYSKKSPPIKIGEEVYYPGEKTLRVRKENLEKGIPVDSMIWHKINDL
jgi:3-dehydro-L-gulonate 2-dehydrogenase